MTRALHQACFTLACLVLFSCGDEPPGASVQEQAPEGPLPPTPDVVNEPAQATAQMGGETSEFGGSRIDCVQAAVQPLDLSDANVAPWVAAIEGHYQLPLVWRRHFQSEAFAAFESTTTVALDVSVLGANDVEYEGGCFHEQTLHLQLSIALSTEDDSLAGTFSHSVRTVPGSSPANGDVMSSPWQPPYPLKDFSGTLVSLDPEANADPSLSVALVFDGDHVRGRLSPDFRRWLTSETGDSPTSGWTPVAGIFPNDGCAVGALPVALDAPLAAFNDQTAEQLFTQVAGTWDGASVPGEWDNGESTEVSFRVSEPMQTCQARTVLPQISHQTEGSLQVSATVNVDTADGALALKQLVELYFEPGQPVAFALTPWRTWIPGPQFGAVTGISGAELGEHAFFRAQLNSEFDLLQATFSGSLGLSTWENFGSASAALPRLGLSW